MSTEPKQYSYANDAIRVSFEGKKCAHAGFCFGELHDVFDGDSQPPIDLKAADTDEVIRVVELCPSSALTYERLDGGAGETPQEQAVATIVRDAQLNLRGDLQLGDERYTRLALCRCGKSQSKPFCDGSHKEHEFDDQAEAAAEEISAEAEGGAITLTPYPNGPVGFSGELTVRSANGEVICRRSKGGLCRCGASQNKPFCDGTHRSIDFEA